MAQNLKMHSLGSFVGRAELLIDLGPMGQTMYGCLSQPLHDKESAVLTLLVVKHSKGNVLQWWHRVDSGSAKVNLQLNPHFSAQESVYLWCA